MTYIYLFMHVGENNSWLLYIMIKTNSIILIINSWPL